MSKTELHTGDCLNVLRTMEDNSVTAVVTDPPYALEFMGQGWDKVLPSADIWREALRVLKPGGMALVFGGTRTYHRLTCSLEDAGFEIRDCMMWLYGSGFPKSHDISKAIDKEAGAEREKGPLHPAPAGRSEAYSGFEGESPIFGGGGAERGLTVDPPATEDAKTWNGYGTALKPAYEPIIVAMKPLTQTFAKNAISEGVAGLNIEACRVGTEEVTSGRWPANVVLDEEAGAQLDAQSGITKGSGPRTGIVGGHKFGGEKGQNGTLVGKWHGDSGGASRFFYCAKASNKDRGYWNAHPTVKPQELMRHLLRLVTMPSGTIVLDPFMGSGTTGVVCKQEGLHFVGIERNSVYAKLAKSRIEQEEKVKTE